MSRRAPFAALLSSYAVSVAGTTMSAIAIPWLVLSTTGSAGQTGLVAFAQMAPYVATQVLAGPVVDRIGLRRAFIWGNTGAAVAVGAIPAIDAAGALRLPVLLALVAVAGAIRGAADCANGSLVPATAEAGAVPLERAAGLYSSASRIAMLLGAPLAGVLVPLAGSPAVVAVDAASFAVAAVIAAVWIRVPAPATLAPAPVDPPDGPGAPDPAVPDPTHGVTVSTPSVEVPTLDSPDGPGDADGSALRRYGRDLAAGFRFIRGDRLLLGLITMIAVTNLLDLGLSEVMVPVWVRDEFGSAGALGLVAGVGGVGALLGNLLGAWIGPRLPRRTLYSVGYLVGGAPRFVVLALTGALVPVLAVTLVAEVFSGSLNSVIGATAYERIPEHLRTRVLGAVRASAWIGVPVGPLVGGYATQVVGLRPALVAFGGVYLVTTLAPFVFPVWRQLRRPDPVAAPDEEGAQLTASA